ncbi:unnamed protein product, partial [Mesorhabditis belari]|uniref:Uncharacterized protein n=1 Tax=Mesorhabditis belari TaxID=2138241 RepID=A0AAF3J2Z2_9BILA
MGSGNSKEDGKSEPKTHYPYSGNRPVADPCQLTRRALEDCLYGDGPEDSCKALIDAHRKCLRDLGPSYPFDYKKSS